MNRDDDPHRLTEADRESETRFGPRPVPKGHRTASPYPHRHIPSSRVIPSAPMSPDGKRPYPAPALSSKVMVWGGVALGVAGITAGALLAARRLAGAIADDPAPRGPVAPLTAHARPQPPRQTAAEVGGPRPAAAPRTNMARDLTRTANDLSNSLNGVAQALVEAFDGFRRVASQANDTISEFSRTADQLRGLMRGAVPPRHPDAASPPDAPVQRHDDDLRRHRL